MVQHPPRRRDKCGDGNKFHIDDAIFAAAKTKLSQPQKKQNAPAGDPPMRQEKLQ
jgi:hypothetical protein